MKRGIKHLAVKGIVWGAVSDGTAQFFRFIVTLVLARLLVPEDFGLMGLASIFIGLVATFTELGLSAALIQRKNITNDHLSTSFVVSLITGLAICLTTIASAPLISDFFHEPRLTPMLFVLAFIFVIGSFFFVPMTLLTKHMNFKTLAFVNIIAELFSGTLAIILALNGFGVWSLVWKIVATNLLLVFCTWLIHPWRPSLHFNNSAFKDLFGFSFNYMGSRITNYVQSNIDNLAVGRFLGIASLGYYSIAYQLVTFPFRRVCALISNVTFPAFSAIRDDQESLCVGYLQVVRYTSIITLPMLAGLFILAPEFIFTILGEKWMPAAMPLRVLSIAGVTMVLTNPTHSVLLAKGRSDIEFRWNITALILLTIVLLLSVQYGLSAVAASVALVTVFVNFYVLMVTHNLLRLDYRKYLGAVYPSIAGSLIMLICIFLMRKILNAGNLSEYLVLICCSIAGVIIYFIVILLTAKYIKEEVLDIIKNVASKSG